MSDSELHPLQMARNCAAAVARAAEHQDRDPLGAYIAHSGTQGAQAAQLAGQLALVSIAEDLRRIADRLCHGPGLASCGHPANEDGECDCSSWPERARF